MTISTYSDLKTDLAGWLHRTNLTSQIPTFIALAEARIYRKLRIRCMETAFSSVTSNGVITLPSGYVELKHARQDGYEPLERKPVAWIRTKYPAGSGSPRYVARDGESLIFGPSPADGVTIKGMYYKRLDALSDTNATNWLLTNASDVLLFGALCEAAPYLANDTRIPVWESKFAAAMDSVQSEDDTEAHSGSPLSIG